MKMDDRNERSSSILGIEDTSVADAPIVSEKTKLMPEERKKAVSLAVAAGAALLAVVVVLIVGAVYGGIAQKKDAARQPRESTPTFYGVMQEEDVKENDITSTLTHAYYTAENGMMLTIEFYNDTDTDKHISKVIVSLHNGKDEKIAQAQSASMKADYSVPAGEANEITMYVKPEYVSITDDPLETLRYEITVEF